MAVDLMRSPFSCCGNRAFLVSVTDLIHHPSENKTNDGNRDLFLTTLLQLMLALGLLPSFPFTVFLMRLSWRSPRSTSCLVFLTSVISWNLSYWAVIMVSLRSWPFLHSRSYSVLPAALYPPDLLTLSWNPILLCHTTRWSNLLFWQLPYKALPTGNFTKDITAL